MQCHCNQFSIDCSGTCGQNWLFLWFPHLLHKYMITANSCLCLGGKRGNAQDNFCRMQNFSLSIYLQLHRSFVWSLTTRKLFTSGLYCTLVYRRWLDVREFIESLTRAHLPTTTSTSRASVIPVLAQVLSLLITKHCQQACRTSRLPVIWVLGKTDMVTDKEK